MTAPADPSPGSAAPDPLGGLDPRWDFVGRHIGPSPAELDDMAREVGYGSLAELVDAAVPPAIRTARPLELPGPLSEAEVLGRLRELAGRNRPLISLIGLGYHGTVTPAVIQRNVLENPAWYTAYTPYQPEISQGRLEALLNFQTMVCDLVGAELANASLLDEATAVAEAMTLCRRVSDRPGDALLVDPEVLPQTLAVVRTRAEPLGIAVEVGDVEALDGDRHFAVVVPQVGASGRLTDLSEVCERAADAGVLTIVTADLLACCLLEPPGALGADVVVGSAQRFGVPPGFGGPHAAYLATRERWKRSVPGRLVGVSVDAAGRPALRLALQTREQHIRRERATSNICTAQVLLAVVAAMYAVWHGPDGLRRIAERVHTLTARLAEGLRRAGVRVVTERFFDTVTAEVPGRADAVVAAALERGINLRRVDGDRVAVTLDETTTPAVVDEVLAAFGAPGRVGDLPDAPEGFPPTWRRRSPMLTHPVFHRHRSETEMMRYLRRLADRDIALDRAMIPLGSCTMKLNAAVEMAPVTWPEFATLHPFAPPDQTAGIRRIIADLEDWLAEITGYARVSVQPNAGSQGELAGLLAIRSWHRSRGDHHRDVCLIPASAHGTNAASAVMAGMRVVVVACDDDGNIDLGDLRAKVDAHADRLAALMITYPSTHGVFEDTVVEVCGIIHAAGGQVYTDGANLNALVGICRLAELGSDVSHLNLHKTFCIPHGGGGPGVGPVGVAEHLVPFLPNHPLVPEAGPATGPGPVAAAPWGSAGILPISWAYILLMGPGGLRRATEAAIGAANYIAARLGKAYDVLYTGRNGLVAHECIIDLRPVTRRTGVTAEDVAKRLIDYGFHAPTMSFPVAGTLMIEPTESESRAELDRFCEAMLAIAAEIDDIASGRVPLERSPLRLAPHPAADVAAEQWDRPYPRTRAAFPVPGREADKYWPPVSRIDQGYGDRHLVCTCPPPEAYADT